MDLLIQYGAKIDAKDVEGQTPLHLAAHSRNSSKALILLEFGASLKIRNRDGFTPLEVALNVNVFSWNHEQKLNLIKLLAYSGMM